VKAVLRFACLLFLVFLPVLLPAGGKKEKADLVTVSGIVRLTGNSPFSELVITGEDMEWHIAKEDEKKLMDLQNRMIIVQGMETVQELKFASGIPAGKRYTLKKIKIISIN
jgi:hypothetical protein